MAKGFSRCALSNGLKKGLPMNNETSKAMRICAALIRDTSCASCLHYEKCKANGYKPVSKLGAYLAWLSMEALQPIEQELNKRCLSGLKLVAWPAIDSEQREGAYAVVRIYEEKPHKRLVARALLCDAIYDEEVLKNVIFKAFFLKRKISYGLK